jgi:deoxyribodipyrimidine photolyase-related protein
MSNAHIDYFLILPTQLYETKYLPKYLGSSSKITVLLWECPWYFNNPTYIFNKKKLLLHKGSMEYYYNYLKKTINVKKIKFNEELPFTKSTKYSMFDPIDDIKLLKLKYLPNFIEESPNFLLTRNNYETYRKKTDKFFFNAFYTFGKKIIGVIPDVTSKDKENRKIFKEDIIPKQPVLNKEDKIHISTAITYINANFKENYGDVKDFMFPVTHKTAKKWLDYFIKHKFAKFGDYQDFINKDNELMFHSLLSTSINIGLLNPNDIIDVIEKYKKLIPINSYEGYIRQLFWREYQRYTYIYFYRSKNRSLNYFGNSKKLTAKWYTGELNILPVDNAIVTGFKTGYLHHISRLMVIGNYMNLSGISPQQGFKWFMEFSCDSYDWVMCQNVYGMVFFSDGGKTMRRPYISSSNYILKMSNHKKDDWSDKWDNAYKDFIKKHKNKLSRFGYYFKH